MQIEPAIIPLDAGADLYALRDEKGQFVGTGTREACEVLLFIVKSCAVEKPSRPSPSFLRTERPNVRAAIRI